MFSQQRMVALLVQRLHTANVTAPKQESAPVAVPVTVPPPIPIIITTGRAAAPAAASVSTTVHVWRTAIVLHARWLGSGPDASFALIYQLLKRKMSYLRRPYCAVAILMCC